MDGIENGPERTSAQTRRAYPRPPVLTARALVLLIPAAIALLLLIIAAPELWTFMVGTLYMVAVYPAVQSLARRGINRAVAILLVYALTILLIVLFVGFIAGPLIGQLAAFVAALPDLLIKGVAWLRDLLNAVGVGLPADAQDSLHSLLTKIVEAVESIVLGLTGGLIATGFSLVGAALSFLIIPFWAFYVMNSWPEVWGSLDQRVPPEWRPDLRAAMSIVGTSFARWLQAQLKASIVAGIFAFIEFQILGVVVDPIFRDFALLLATISFIFEFIPNIGPTIAFIPQLFVGLLVGPIGIVAVSVGFFVAQQLENAVIIPRIQGQANDLHPAVILFVLVVGGAIFGILGIILSVPVTATAVRLTRYFFGRASGLPPGERSGAPAPDPADDEPAAATAVTSG